MNPESLKQAREAAEKASKDEWTYHGEHGVYYVSNGKDGKFAKFDNRICEAVMNFNLGPDDKPSNMKHIATMSPSFTLQLLDHVERLEKKLEKAREALKIISHPYTMREDSEGLEDLVIDRGVVYSSR